MSTPVEGAVSTFRYQDEIDAAEQAQQMISQVIGALSAKMSPVPRPSPFALTTHTLTEGGGVITLWSGTEVAAQATIVRDTLNWSVLTFVQVLNEI